MWTRVSWAVICMHVVINVSASSAIYFDEIQIRAINPSPPPCCCYTPPSLSLVSLQPTIHELLFGKAREGLSVGCLTSREKPVIFAMDRLDKVKNLTGVGVEGCGGVEMLIPLLLTKMLIFL